MTVERFTATIPPVDDPGRPLWSVLVPTYNCAAFLEEALDSILVQDPGPDRMEIIVIDDYSTRDNPAEVVRRKGRSRVRFVQQPGNVGKVRNYETGLAASRGHLIHQLHGDDRVRSGFYAAMEQAFEKYPEAGAFFCESFYINGTGEVIGRTGNERNTTGILEGWLEKIVVEQRVQTPSIVVRRDVYERLGAFDRRLDVCEDWEMWIRIANNNMVGFVPEALAEYRVSGSNTSAAGMVSGQVAADIREVIRIADGYLHPSVVANCGRNRNKAMAQRLIEFVPHLLEARAYAAAARAGRDALSFSHDARTLYRLARYTVNGMSNPRKLP